MKKKVLACGDEFQLHNTMFWIVSDVIVAKILVLIRWKHKNIERYTILR